MWLLKYRLQCRNLQHMVLILQLTLSRCRTLNLYKVPCLSYVFFYCINHNFFVLFVFDPESSLAFLPGSIFTALLFYVSHKFQCSWLWSGIANAREGGDFAILSDLLVVRGVWEKHLLMLESHILLDWLVVRGVREKHLLVLESRVALLRC